MPLSVYPSRGDAWDYNPWPKIVAATALTTNTIEQVLGLQNVSPTASEIRKQKIALTQTFNLGPP